MTDRTTQPTAADKNAAPTLRANWIVQEVDDGGFVTKVVITAGVDGSPVLSRTYLARNAEELKARFDAWLKEATGFQKAEAGQ